MILSDQEISELHILENASDRSMTPNGYDMRIKEVKIDGKSFFHGSVRISKGTPFFVGTEEVVNLVGKNICASLFIRSSFARKSIFISDGKVDAGFRGTITVSCVTFSDIVLNIGERFVQIVFERLESSPDKQYFEYSGSYQNQTSVEIETSQS